MPTATASLPPCAHRPNASNVHPDPDYRRYQQTLTEFNCGLAAQVHNSTSPEQRKHAQAKLKGWEDDLRSLIAAPQ